MNEKLHACAYIPYYIGTALVALLYSPNLLYSYGGLHGLIAREDEDEFDASDGNIHMM